MTKQILSRVKVMQCRGAEILRILYKLPPGIGERLSRREVYNELVKRRAIDSPIADHDVIRDGDSILTRPSAAGFEMLRKSVDILVVTGLIEKMQPGVFRITESGRTEAEIWFPELLNERLRISQEQL